ncbi:hypothetical protein GF367_03085, partial [Candidatus Woesearchaeota archaeon]|nr:hypothetical protein [Candidatus Woesearchaeota archaeon]
MQKTPPFPAVFEYWELARKEVINSWRFVRALAREYWSQLIIMLGFKRTVKLEYYGLDAPGKHLHLLLVSLLKKYFREKKPDELLGLTYQYSVRNLLDVGAMLLSFGLRTTYHDPHPDDVTYLNALIRKGLRFRNKAANRIDMEASLQNGNPIVCLVNELGEKNTIVQSVVLVYGFDKLYFYYHDYLHGRQGLRATKDQFMHAWSAAGYKGVFLERE